METATKSFASLTHEELLAISKEIQEATKGADLADLSFSYVNETVFSEDPKRESAFISFDSLVSSSKADKLEGLSSKLSEILKPYGEEALRFEVEVGLGAGEKFPKIESIQTVPQGDAASFEPKTGEVVLVDFWATWCGPCQAPMAHNQEMLHKNAEKWKDKVRIVGVSFDKTIPDVVKRIEEKKWNLIEHYFAPGGFQSEAAKPFGINGIPCVYLVDQNGIIVYRGHPSSVDLEAKINGLLDGAKTEEGAPKKAEPIERANIKSIEEKHTAGAENLKNVAGFYFVVVDTLTFAKPNTDPEFTGAIHGGGSITVEDVTPMKNHFKDLLALVPSKYTKNVRLSQTIVLPIHAGKACETCKADISSSAQLHCAKCNVSFCHKCADVELEKDITDPVTELFHPHGLLLIDKPTADPIALKRVFNDSEIVGKDHSRYAGFLESKVCPGVYCDGCGGNLKKYRYSCGHCPDFDLCPECFALSKNVNDEKFGEFSKKMEQKKHDLNTHLVFRAHHFCLMKRQPPVPVTLD